MNNDDAARFFDKILSDDRLFDVDAYKGTVRDATVRVSPKTSRELGVFLDIHNEEMHEVVHLADIGTISLVIKHPGAAYIPRPVVYTDGGPTVFGAGLSAKKGFVPSPEDIGTIQAPRCPFCEEELQLSQLVEGMGTEGVKASRHLWVCRCCSGSDVTSPATITNVARRLKDANQAVNTAPGSDSAPAGS